MGIGKLGSQLIALILCLLQESIAQRAIKFINEFPSDITLMAGDILKYPLENYVNVKGAVFTIDTNNASHIIPNVNLQATIPLAEGTTVTNCDAMVVNGQDTYMICNGVYLVIARFDPTLKTKTFGLVKTLSTTLIPDSYLNCYDLVFYQRTVYAYCNSRAPSPPPNTIVIFSIETSTYKYTSTKCENVVIPAPIRSVVVPVMSGDFAHIFFTALPRVATGTEVNIATCKTNTIDNSISPSSTQNIANFYAATLNITLNSTVRSVASLSTTELLVVLAGQYPGDKCIEIIVLNIDNSATLSKSNYERKTWRQGMFSNFEPKDFAASIEISPAITFISLVNLQTHIVLNLTFNKYVQGEYQLQIAQPSVNTMDCSMGNPNTFYVGKIFEIAKNALYPERNRQLVEYRSYTDNKIKEFGVYFYQSKYGCSKASANFNDLRSINLVNSDYMTSTRDSEVHYYKLDPSTFLYMPITPAMATGANVSRTVTASLSGMTDGTTTLTFSTISSPGQSALFKTVNKNFKAYTNTKFALPFSNYQYLGNNASFSFNTTNIQLLHANFSTPNLNLSLPPGYAVERILVVDFDTSVAVLKKPGFPRAYSVFFTLTNSSGTVIVRNTDVPALASGQNLYRAFKLGSDHYCLIFKSTDARAPKLVISCFEDKVDGQIKLNKITITELHEVYSMEYIQAYERVDVMMVGVSYTQGRSINQVLHYWVTLNSDSTVTCSPKVISLDFIHQSLADYTPTDLAFDYVAGNQGANHLVVKFRAQQHYPLVARFNVSFEGNGVELKYLSQLKLPQSDVAFCPIRHDVMLYNPRTREITAVTWNNLRGIPSYSIFKMPLTEYGMVYVVQMLCIPEKGLVQFLVVNSNKEKFVITYRGTEAFNSARRVHSIVKVDPFTSYIDYGPGSNYILTVANVEGGNDVKRYFLQIYENGPHIFVNNANITGNYSIKMTVSTSSSSADETVLVQMLHPTLVASPKPTATFPIKQGGFIYLEDYATFNGPVFDVIMSGETNGGLNITKRNNRNRGFTTGETTKPNKLVVERDFMTVLYKGVSVKLYGDPAIIIEDNTTPTLIDIMTGSIRDFAMTRYGMSEQAAVVVKEFSNSQYQYSVIILTKVVDGNKKPVYLREAYYKIFSTKEDYVDMLVVCIENVDLVLAMKSKDDTTTNIIKLVTLKRDAGKFIVTANQNVMSFNNKRIDSWSVVSAGGRRIAVLTSTFGEVGFQVTIWDTSSRPNPLTDNTEPFTFNQTDLRRPFIEYIRCFPSSYLKIECVIDIEGATDVLAMITFEENPDIAKKYVKAVNVTGEFEMPPQYGLKKLSVGKEVYSFLLKKSEPATVVFPTPQKRILQASTIDNYLDCNEIIVSYKPKKSKYIYTGVTCSEWNNATDIDFDMEEIGGRDYIFFAKDGPKTQSGSRLLQNANSDKVGSNYISGITLRFDSTDFNPEQVFFKFVGLGGQTSPEDQKLSLKTFSSGVVNPPDNKSSNWLVWVLLILLAIGVIAGAYFGWRWYSNKVAEKKNGQYISPKTNPNDYSSAVEEIDEVRL
jgi:hypothetical protein